MTTTFDFAGGGDSYGGMCGNCNGTGSSGYGSTDAGGDCPYCKGSGQIHANPPPAVSSPEPHIGYDVGAGANAGLTDTGMAE